MKPPVPGVIWTTFLKGLAVVLPVSVTVAVLYWLGASLERVLGGLMLLLLPDVLYLPGMGIAAGIALTFAAGVAMRIWITRQLLAIAERLVERIPLAKTVYGGVRDLLEFLSRSGKSRGMDQVVLVSLEGGVKLVGFVTDAEGPILRSIEQADGDVAGADGDEDDPQVAVYLPLSYQIGGFTVFLPRSRLRRLDMGIEEAMRWVLTAGVSPGKPRGQQA